MSLMKWICAINHFQSGNVSCSIFFDRRLPEWARDIVKPGSTFETLTTYWFQLSTATTLMKRLKSGFLLKEILDQFKNKTLSVKPKQLMRMYSGHETTMASMLNSLGLYEVNSKWIQSNKLELIKNLMICFNFSRTFRRIRAHLRLKCTKRVPTNITSNCSIETLPLKIPSRCSYQIVGQSAIWIVSISCTAIFYQHTMTNVVLRIAQMPCSVRYMCLVF